MKKKAFKEILKYVRVIVFFAVITILVEAVNYVMVQPGYARYIIHTVDNPDDGSDYDCIVVGASHGRASIDPHYFLEMEYAVNPINMCIQGATVIDNYYMIREACNNNDVKKIILELDYQYWNKNLKRDSDFGDLLVYGQLPFTSLKMEYIVSQLMDKDFRTIYFRRYAFARNWKTAKKYMAIKKTDEYKNFQIEGVAGIDTEGPYQGLGFFYRTKVTDKKGKLNPSPWTYEDLNPKVQKYFQKIVKYCKDNGIELICVTTPIPPSSVASGTANEANTYFKQICDENNVKYIDGNLIKNEVLDVSDDDYETKMEVTENTLREIGAGEIPVLRIFNKVDLLKDTSRLEGICVSAKNGDHMDRAMKEILKMLYPSEESMYCLLPYDKIYMFDEYRQVLQIDVVKQDEEGMTLYLQGPSDYIHAFDLYQIREGQL